MKLQETISLPKDLAAGMAIRVEDVYKIMENLLEGAEESIAPQDYKRLVLVTMARDRNSHLKYIINVLRGEVS